MSIRPKLAGLFAALTVSVALVLAACSSSSPQDINKGTDVGLGYVPPDAGPDTPPEVGLNVAEAGNTASGVDGAADSQTTIDSEMALDVSMNATPDAAIDVAIDGEY